MYKRVYFLSFIAFILLILTGALISLNILADDIPCTYTYSPWSTCNSFGTKTRSYTAIPGGCYIVDYPVTSQYCCNYVYTNWTPCEFPGIQRRYVSSAMAEGCNEFVAPVLEQTCDYTGSSTVACTYTHSDWGDCSTAGIKTRTYTATPDGCYQAQPPETQQSCCNYVYSDWSSCNASGTQNRSVTAVYPTGCVDYVGPTLQQTCNYSGTGNSTSSGETSTSTITCVIQCGDWGICSSLGIQTRLCVPMPSGCTPNPNENIITQRTCTTTTSTTTNGEGEGETITSTASTTTTTTTNQAQPCTYTYSSWSDCDSSGKQKRTVILKSPSGCYDAETAITEQTCSTSTSSTSTTSGGYSTTTIIGFPCVYTYSQWGDCESSGVQHRMLTSKSPDNCSQIEGPVLEQSCTYIPSEIGAGGTAIGFNATSVTPNVSTPCTYNYSAWGECVSGKKLRMVISKSPIDCVESITPELTQSCKTPTSVPAMPKDMPLPAPQSVLLTVATTGVATATEVNLNERTSSDWQKYYFKSSVCTITKTCAGSADPDNDGLTNNDEYRFGTNPKLADTDHDGYIDGYEIQTGHNPLIAETKTVSDAMIFENPKTKGEVKKEILKVNTVEPISREDVNKGIKIGGQALSNIYVAVFIYSSDPIVLAIKTDSNGNWSYVLDRHLEDGEHEVYVAVTDNTGKLTAKSEPLAFVKTAQAMEMAPFPKVIKPNPEISPTKSWLEGSYLIFILIGASGFLLAVLTLGFIKYGISKKEKDDANN